MSSRLQQLKAACMAVEIEMAEERGRFDALLNRHDNGTAKRVITSFNLFITPIEVARKMAAMIPVGAKKILEPSAGTGRLYNEIKNYQEITLVEDSPDCCAELYRITSGKSNVELFQRDFLSVEPSADYDAVIMNPPFKQGRDVKHIQHALNFLRPGGVLIGLCYNGVRQNEILFPLASTWEVLPPGSFKASGTMADVAMIVINK